VSTGPTIGDSAIDRMLAAARVTLPPRPAAADLPALFARGALIVDTRPQGLRDRDGELAGAVVVDRNQLEWRLDPTSAYRIAEVTGADQEIVVVCDEGYASSLAAATLQQLGLSRATDLDGGFQAVLTFARARARAPAQARAGGGRTELTGRPGAVTG
jgi:rhodanese-related sulfurtransferase